MQIAGQRLTAHNQRQHRSARRQAHAVLMAVLGARRPELREHLRVVVYRAIALGRRLGLSREEMDDVALAAELQDVGLLAVPEAVLEKRTALSPEEAAMIRNRPVAGEQIIGSAPGPGPGRRPRPLELRALRRQRLPRRPRRRGDPAGGADHRRRRRLRGADGATAIPCRRQRRGGARGAAPLRRHPVRPTRGRGAGRRPQRRARRRPRPRGRLARPARARTFRLLRCLSRLLPCPFRCLLGFFLALFKAFLDFFFGFFELLLGLGVGALEALLLRPC